MRRLLVALLVATLGAGGAAGASPRAGDPAIPETAAPTVGAANVIGVRGSGNGHGVGMSQYGALHRAEAGHSATRILGAYYPGTTVGPDDVPITTLRVRVVSDATRLTLVPQTRLTVRGLGPSPTVVRSLAVIALRANRVRVVADGTVLCGGTSGNRCPAVLRIRHPQGRAVTVAAGPVGAPATPYLWGSIMVHRLGDQPALQAVIARLPLERYLRGLGEVPASWPAAALEAQAIAGRSFASVTVAQRRASPAWTVPWDLESGQIDQVYLGATIELDPAGAPWVRAVDATDGLVVRNGTGGPAITTNYSATNGGYAESSAYVWGSPLPWLVAQLDPFDAPTPYSTWRRSYTSGELRRWLTAAGVADPGRIERIRVTGPRGESGRIDQATVVIVGARATARVNGRAFVTAVNAGVIADGDATRTLPSTLLRLRVSTP